MSVTIPARAVQTKFHKRIVGTGLKRVHQGKVRDTYELPDQLLLVVATDRISIYDFVLPAEIPRKGEILTALTVFWLTALLSGIRNHLVACGPRIDEYLPAGIRHWSDLQRRALVVRRLTMLPVECIVRGYLTGSGWTSYQQNRQVCGIQLPERLRDGSRIEGGPIFTPTTKAAVGHDEHVPTDSVIETYGAWLQERSLLVYQRVADFAHGKGIILADTKFEFTAGGVLADEVGTPDSSRFWDLGEWITAQSTGKSPAPYDKQIVRNWGAEHHQLGKRDPEKAGDLAYVSRIHVPMNVLSETAERYLTVFERLTGLSLTEFQKRKMDIV